MKKIFFFTTLLILLSAGQGFAAKAGFSWLPNEEPNLTGYKIYYGTESRAYTVVVDVGNPDTIDGRVHTEIEGLQDGETYFFSATAYNDAGESDYSTEVERTLPLYPSPNIINIHIVK